MNVIYALFERYGDARGLDAFLAAQTLRRHHGEPVGDCVG
jgi:hypothetical protein